MCSTENKETRLEKNPGICPNNRQVKTEQKRAEEYKAKKEAQRLAQGHKGGF